MRYQGISLPRTLYKQLSDLTLGSFQILMKHESMASSGPNTTVWNAKAAISYLKDTIRHRVSISVSVIPQVSLVILLAALQ